LDAVCDDDTLVGANEPSLEESDAQPVKCTLDQGKVAEHSDGGLEAKGDKQQDPDITSSRSARRRHIFSAA